jgi:hypothetical protein
VEQQALALVAWPWKAGGAARACEQESATPDLARQVGRFLRRLEREPQLRFEAV